MPYCQQKKVIIKITKRVMNLINKRNHTYICGTYKNKTSKLIIWCNVHCTEHTTTFDNYQRSRTGCLCCGRVQTSKKLTNRRFSQETLKKMSVSAQNRTDRNKQILRWRETMNYRKWRKHVLSIYNWQCAITGTKKKRGGDLVVHHLYGAKNFPHLIHHPKNGIVLQKYLHVAFHNQYGYTSNTLDQFLLFLLNLCQNNEKMLTKNQKTCKNVVGLETRDYDYQRIHNLYKNLETLNIN